MRENSYVLSVPPNVSSFILPYSYNRVSMFVIVTAKTVANVEKILSMENVHLFPTTYEIPTIKIQKNLKRNERLFLIKYKSLVSTQHSK